MKIVFLMQEEKREKQTETKNKVKLFCMLDFS